MKVEEFINLRKWNMILEEYSLKFIMLLRYAPSLVSNPRDEMSRFVTGGCRPCVKRVSYDHAP